MSAYALKLTEPVVDDAEVEAVRRVLESGWLAEGEVTKQFERKVATYIGAKYAVATCNCTVALELCLRALNVKGEVVVPDFTHPATAQAVINAGATPILVDVHLNTYNVDVDKFPLDTLVAIPVSWAGNPVWSVPYTSATIIEDAACSLGAEIDGAKIGSEFTSCFSFHPRKLITTGEGGMVTTNNEELAEKIRALKNFGEGGGNYKLSDIASVLGLAQMNKLDIIIKKRIAMAIIYDELLSEVPNVRTPQKHPLAKHTYQTYAVYLEKGDRNQIIQKLAEKCIETQIGTYALHLLPQFKNVKRIGSLHNSELLYHHLLALPMAYSMTDEDQKRVVDELKQLIA